MKIAPLVLSGLCVFLLSGCMASPGPRLHLVEPATALHATPRSFALAERKSREEMAWAEVERLSASRCGSHGALPARAEAVALSHCVTRLVVAHVLPHAALRDAVLSSRSEAHRLAQDYANGRLTENQYRLKSMERMQDYHKAWARYEEEKVLEAAEAYWIGDQHS
jgi:hypothetical protein